MALFFEEEVKCTFLLLDDCGCEIGHIWLFNGDFWESSARPLW
jgi:hypothetical protein